MKSNKLKIGDTINWKSQWGANPSVKAKVKTIEICPIGCKNGKQVQSVSWDTIKNGNRNIVIIMENGHWAQSADSSFFRITDL